MSAFKEMLPNDSFIDDEGDIRPYADIKNDFDSRPVSSASKAQALVNLERHNADELLVEQGEAELRMFRERRVTDAALENVGVYVSLDEHRQHVADLADLAGTISMYRGGEAGGFESRDFIERYGINTTDVIKGAKKNHAKLINRVLPKIYKADELKAAGFDSDEIDHDATTTMRSQLMSRYGGTENKKARSDLRKRFQK